MLTIRWPTEAMGPSGYSARNCVHLSIWSRDLIFTPGPRGDDALEGVQPPPADSDDADHNQDIASGVYAPTTIARADSDDRAVLVALYNAADGDNWVIQDNWLSGEPLGQWYGVTANGNDRVTELRLSDNRLSGELPEGLGNLANLQVLKLGANYTCDSGGCRPDSPSPNRLTGTIPPALGSRTNLERLQLSGNQLTGCIPQDLRGIPTNDFSSLGLPFCDMPGAPTIATLISAGETSLTVTWTVPINTGTSAITAYDLRYIDNGAADKSDANWTVLEDVWTTGSGSLQYTLTWLTDGTQYDVQVRAVNSGGDGAWSVTGTTASAVVSLVNRYDANGTIEKSEVIAAINDYFFGEGDEAIGKAEVIEIINLYLFGPT